MRALQTEGFLAGAMLLSNACTTDYSAFSVDGHATAAGSGGAASASSVGAGAASASGTATGTGTSTGTGATGGGGASAASSGSGAGGQDGGGGPQIAVAGELLVWLDAEDPSAGSGSWKNSGSLGDFSAAGSPSLMTFGSVSAVVFDGVADAYTGPDSVASIEGTGSRSIEVWVENPSVDSGEETMVSWSERGGPNGTMMSFNYGTSTGWGAATHWSASSDMPWGGAGPPSAGAWHHLAYTYDGATARVYEDGAEKNNRNVALDTKASFPINVAAQRLGGALQFTNEYDGTQQGGSMRIAVVRIHDGALGPSDVMANYLAELPRFQ